jgi:hypothetical protein
MVQDGTDGIPTFVVNLPEDQDRFQIVTSQLDPACFEVRDRIGFLGRSMPDIACVRLTRDPKSVINKGALGVMMSHIWIWERVARLETPFALVIEDDVRLNYPARLATASLPSEFDLIFCGDQTAPEDLSDDPAAPLDCIPAIQSLSALESRGVSVGAYGYLLSPKGARLLVKFFAEDFYFGHVDVRMMAYCCGLDELNGLGQTTRVGNELRAIRKLVGNEPQLAGYAMVRPLVTHVGMTSRRAREDALGLTREFS